ncbi:RND family efflux transporter, MFP subunit [Nitrosospira multiformis ATCC 25196]|uniref:RND family efflux transporter, MFP subunit n=2 Tax=Nitrosospira multiformis (strain ATCC 25196 / NCIMB 11849 / C 71) TaxID=323848 RepID=A0A1H5TAM6_NITMU|nr:efflux RND transporter periplasmic adaptor subunit [Nitrosospira multiformis]SEF59198.1 RND family efflux transporter, MFP subunit [Nitrosospira multiformis ATCC 25196]
MEAISEIKRTTPVRRLRVTILGFILAALIAGTWMWRNPSGAIDAKKKTSEPTPVITAVINQQNVPVQLAANGTVSAQQMVAVRPQLSAMISAVHIREGQFVRKGEPLFTLDARTEDANVRRTEGQLAKSRADLRNAERNLERQRELFRQDFISQAALDVAENQVDALRAQLTVDEATAQANRIARGFSEITAPISGRSGAISVYQGSLVQPNDALVSITQIDPINVSFTLPERDFIPLQQAFAKGEVPVTVELNGPQKQTRTGRLIFIDNAVDTASGTIRLKAEFPNADRHLWPGMFVMVSLAPQTLIHALTVPVQAVQNGPEGKFLYVLDETGKVKPFSVEVRLVQEGVAVVEGKAITSGMHVVAEGAQNLRPGSAVTEASSIKTGAGAAGRNS